MWYYIQAVRTNGFSPQMSAGLREQNMRGWRNWQTRTFEVRVVYPWGFESPPSHQKNSTRYRRKFDASWSFLFAVVSDTARYCRKMPDFAVPLSENVVCCRVKMSVLMGDDFCRIVLSAACAMGGGVVC